jgi:hypothetical protein
MRLAWKWLFVGSLIMVGALWFAARGAMALGLSVDETPVVTAAFAIGALIGGAAICRHALVQPWREPLICAAAAFGLFAVLGYLRDGLDSVSGPMWGTSIVENVVSIAVVLVAAVAGAWLARRFSARPPSTGSLLVLGGLITSGTLMSVAGIAGITGGSDEISTPDVLIILLLPAVGGFLTQAVVAVRRPWTCGAGVLLMVLLFVQESIDDQIGELILGMAVITLIDVAGAAIAARVFRARWSTRVDMPEATTR